MYSLKHQEIDVDEVIVDVVEEVIGLSVAERSLDSLKKYFEQRPNDALSHIKSIQGFFISSFGSFSLYYYRLFLFVSLVGRISSSYYYIYYLF